MKFATLAFVLGALSSATGCADFAPIDDPGFDSWCGSKLCEWETNEGSIARVSTWNTYDYGVELVGTPTILSQRIDVSLGECLHFKILANVEAKAQVTLDFDVFDDGVIDHSETIPGVRWGKQELLVKMPTSGVFGAVRLALHKQGSGHAVFAELSAEQVGGCEGEPFVVTPPVGSECTQDEDCSGGICLWNVQENRSACFGCQDDSQCKDGKVCGSADESFIGLPTGASLCVEPASHQLGQQCRRQAECVAGSVCAVTLQSTNLTARNCSECSADADCSDGRICGVADLGDATARFRTCGVPASRPQGHACFIDAECESGRCCTGLSCAAPDGACPP